ncbi:unnamed protein product [Danaus chrysippus]|uniref:(African queen) hypothetical protein n=1 Tax=Danaus chrysippus TaxID=151541 RepID=A0A8J2QJA7_9NEOP|nr:unnamed protein product [Danaus chrysippus]
MHDCSLCSDVDTTRPDERSVITYVASYYHTFARMKNDQKSGCRIANIIGQLMDYDGRKAEYSRLVSALLDWIRLKIDYMMNIQKKYSEQDIVKYQGQVKERSEIEALYFDINTMQKSLVGEPSRPAASVATAGTVAFSVFQSVLRKGYLKEMIQVLSDPRYRSNVAQVDAIVKKHEAISVDILARTERFEDLSAMTAELVKEKYHAEESISHTEQAVLGRWRELLALLERHRAALAPLAQMMALLRAQFQSEEVDRQLVDVERLLQARRARETTPLPPRTHWLMITPGIYFLVAAAKDRTARLEDARNLYQFLEDHEEEEGEWLMKMTSECKDLYIILKSVRLKLSFAFVLGDREAAHLPGGGRGQGSAGRDGAETETHRAAARATGPRPGSHEAQEQGAEIGLSLQKSDPGHAEEVSSRLQALQTTWAALVAASRDKGAKLRQASQQRMHRR